MQKVIEESNAITWFEIPVTDMARAKKFYETILDMEMKTIYDNESKEEVSFFPFKPDNVIRAASGRVSGVLTKNNRVKPSDTGTMVYINAAPDIQAVLDKIEPAGGKIIAGKTKIMAGLIAVIIDTEGNKVGLHSMD